MPILVLKAAGYTLVIQKRSGRILNYLHKII